MERMCVDNRSVEVDIAIRSLIEQNYGVIEAFQRGIGALELEIEDVVVEKVVAKDNGVDLDEMVDGFGIFD